ncbi:MAG: PQQ-dependent sugar dehydrogenase [Verrucomicrobiota bacterium]|nr:PQQ-dependent sugar dehydrogenase [Verrucomicrobiota bacterium]
MTDTNFSSPRGFLGILLVSTIIGSSLPAQQIPAPSDIYVGYGYFSGEYYNFFTDQAGSNQISISDYVFYKGNTYTFHKIVFDSHPFYLSDIPQSSGSYHLGTLTLPVTSSATVSRFDGIVNGESMSITIPFVYSEQLHYYCTRINHSRMVASLNVDDPPPSYINSARLVITEVDRESNYLEVTYFGEDNGELEADTTITNVLGDTLTISEGTSFSSGQTREFSSSLSGAGHLQLIALDASNPDYWVPVPAQDDSNKGYFFDEQVVADPLPDVPQGEIAIGLQTVVSGLSHLIGLADPNDGTGRLFLVEQEGKVRVLNSDGSISPNNLIDVSSSLTPLVLGTIGYDERGLLGMALSPNFAEDGTLYFYASYPKGNAAPDFTLPSQTLIMDGTGYDDIDHHSVIIKRTIADDNLDKIFDSNDSYADTEILRFEQPTSNSFSFIGSNHNGGHLFFDTNGLLMVAIGDGGDANDTGNGHSDIGNGADATNILGTLIRIDPDGNNSSNGKYGIPADNPFVGHPTYLPEIYAYGFRNPWTFSQDPATGAIYSSDSGQNTIQEVNRVLPGKNYGWRAKEGTFLFDPVTGNIGSLYNAPSIEGLEDPIVEYDHDQGYANIIGGHIYRGSLIPRLQGAYICGDYGPFQPPGELFYVEDLNNSPTLKRFQIGVTDRPLLSDVRAFSVDAAGEIYFVGNSNGQSSLYKIVPLAHLDISTTSDEVELTVTGDEDSQITLEKSSDLDFTNSEETTVNGGKLIQTYPLEDKAFFRVTAE